MTALTRLGAFCVLLPLALACHGGCAEQTPPATTAAPASLASATTPPPAPAVVAGGFCPAPATPKNPIEYGRCVLAQSVARSASAASVQVVLASDPSAQGVTVDAAPESYAVVSRGQETLVVGRDDVGAMYGALDVAERLDTTGATALPLAAPVKASPFMKVRAANLFLVLPEAGRPWWFRDPEFWTEYLDMMVRARMNLLDMHGMYNLENTYFPNVLLSFATAASMPDVGIPRAERETNLAMLNTVLRMAEVRGIRVALMNYQMNLSLPGDEKETPEEKALVPQYNKEGLTDLVTRAPGLAYVGFRVGETGHKPEWYVSTYVDTLRAAHSKAIAYTRTWLTKKSELLTVIQSSGPETLVEAKYNGEQLGPPYVISGGGMQHWGSYAYQEFLEEPAPYRFVFQVRAGGTHRIFRYASYGRTRRTVLGMGISPRVQGFTLEAAHAYFPQRDFYHADPNDSFSPYAFRRDEMSYYLFGRLGYDPNTPEAVFRKLFADRVGTDALWPAVQAASDIVPWMLAGHTCGPDQRDYAPELDIGGPVAYWASPENMKEPVFGFHPKTKRACKDGQQPFDAFAVAGPYEAANDLLAGRGTSRLSPVDLALILLADARTARAAKDVTIDPNNKEARDVVRECTALADLGEWYAHKSRAAIALAVFEGSGSDAFLAASKKEAGDEIAAYTALVHDTEYILPFDEEMRMSLSKLSHFHWREQLPLVKEDLQSIEEAAADQKAKGAPSRARGSLPAPGKWLDSPRGGGPGLVDLKVSPEDPRASSWTVTATFLAPPPPGARVHILSRKFASNAGDWAATDAQGEGKVWKANIQGTGAGAFFAVEVEGGPQQAWRYPDVTKEAPYRQLAP